ncbi:hypothetical protein FH972_005911 [Carpinus fangiana]|uniref:Uncharacterized protein n=1 Tax=Carpinus fangiana TaxID=176857 RepID=A0A5N6QR07_9ROSI|nr:hypothetical protein FH972_005911 [Carpinus fangiana]
MEDELHGVVPCSSLAVDSILRVGTVPKLDLFFNMRRRSANSAFNVVNELMVSLTQVSNVRMCLSQELKSTGYCLFRPDMIAYVNGLVAGAVAGAAVAARTRNWTQVIGMAGLVSAFSAAADYSRTS